MRRDDPIGHIRRLLVNLPPSTAKSYFMSVCLAPWTWTWWPGARFLYFSYDRTRALKDSVRARDLVGSRWYQRLFGDIVRIVQGQDQKSAYSTSGGGERQVSYPGGMATGEHPDVIVIDDPMKADDAVGSEDKREEQIDWYFRTLSTRGIARDASHVVGQQRLHVRDLSGGILDYIDQLNFSGQENPWHCVMLPMRFDTERKMVDRGYGGDWRTEQGELLCPELLPEKVVAQVERDLSATEGTFAVDAQLQQDPQQQDGKLFECSQIPDEVFADFPDTFDEVHRYWDLAGTDGGGCETSGVAIGKKGDDLYMLDVNAGQWDGFVVEDEMEVQAKVDNAIYSEFELRTSFEREGGSGGKQDSQVKELRMAAYAVTAVPPKGNKVARAAPLANLIRHGRFHMPKDAPWFGKTLAQFQMFPSGAKDRVDSTTGAVNEILVPTHKAKKVAFASDANAGTPSSYEGYGRCTCERCDRPAFVGEVCCEMCKESGGKKHSPQCIRLFNEWYLKHS